MFKIKAKRNEILLLSLKTFRNSKPHSTLFIKLTLYGRTCSGWRELLGPEPMAFPKTSRATSIKEGDLQCLNTVLQTCFLSSRAQLRETLTNVKVLSLSPNCTIQSDWMVPLLQRQFVLVPAVNASPLYFKFVCQMCVFLGHCPLCSGVQGV